MFSLIVACDSKNGIGKNGKLPWNLPEDLRRFKNITNKSNIIMGRKTWESLPIKPLPNRHNIVISHTLKSVQGATVCKDLQSALKCLENTQTYIIGGSYVYNETMNHPDCGDIIITRVFGNFECDTFINKPPDNFICIFKSEIQTNNNVEFQTEIWSKI